MMKLRAGFPWMPLQFIAPLAWVAWLGQAWLPQPLVIDEVVFAQIAHAPLSAFGHPPGYLHALGVFAALFHLPDVWLRLIGVLALLITAIATHRLAQRLESGAGAWAVGLLLTNPLVLRGAFVLDIDNTLMMAWVAASVCWLAHASWPLSRRAVVGLGFWWALGLWIKLTTPWLWPLALAAGFAVRGQWGRGIKSAGLMAAVGLAAFLSAWTLYSWATHVSWNAILSGRIIDMILRGASDRGLALLPELGERAARIGLWLGPLTIILWIAASAYWLRHRKQLQPPQAWAAALAMGWGVLLGYWVIGGVIWSLARYHSPLVPLMAAIIAAVIHRRLHGVCLSAGSVLLPVCVVALWCAGLLGDPLYLVNYTLRHAMLFEPEKIRMLLLDLALGQASVLMLVVALALIFRRRHPAALSGAGAILLALVLGCMGSGIGLAIRQRAAPYSTSYCYGRPWQTFHAIRSQVLAFHKANPDAKVMAPFDAFQGQIPFDDFLKVFVNEWFAVESQEKFLNALKDPKLGLCILDFDFSSSHAVKTRWASEKAKILLSMSFIPVKLGTAQGWLRKDQPGPL